MLDLDTKLFRAINNLAGQSEFWDQIFIFSARYGILIFAVILIFLLFRRRKMFWTALFSAILARGILVELVRFFYNRPRPFVALQNVKVLIEKEAGEPSFPSGNAAFIFAIAVAAYLFNKKIGVMLIALALILSLARIYTGLHYPLDIIGGIATAGLSVFMIRKLI